MTRHVYGTERFDHWPTAVPTRSADTRLAALRAQIAAELHKHRATSTRYGDEYKNPVRKGYDMGLSKVLKIIDTTTGLGDNS